MSVEAVQTYALSRLSSVHEQDVVDFSSLLDTLVPAKAPHGTEAVAAQIERAVASATTTVFVLREDQDHGQAPIDSTATLSRLPLLSGEGSAMWIDDVVTRPEAQGRGLSKRAMWAMHEAASQHSHQVSLTSSPERGPARAAYTKLGYELFPNDLAIYRNPNMARQRPDGVEMLTDYSQADIEVIAGLLNQDPESLERNMQAVLLNAATTALFVRRQQQTVSAVAAANLTPIPVGYKPWIDDIAGQSPADKAAVIQAGEYWFGQHQAPYANIVANSTVDLPDGYMRRASGLFIKQLTTEQ